MLISPYAHVISLAAAFATPMDTPGQSVASVQTIGSMRPPFTSTPLRPSQEQAPSQPQAEGPAQATDDSTKFVSPESRINAAASAGVEQSVTPQEFVVPDLERSHIDNMSRRSSGNLK